MKSYILSLETSSDTCSVALHRQGVLIASTTSHIPQSHHRVLTYMIRHVWSVSDTSAAALEAVAVSHGPGSYTGLRIGLSLAKGLAYGCNIPLLTVNTLEALAHQGRQIIVGQGYIGALMDARRERVYGMIMDNAGRYISGASLMKIPIDDLPITPTSRTPLYLIGNGADRYAALLQKRQPYVHIIQGVLPQATQVGELAYHKYCKKEWKDLAYIEPLYLSE